MSGVVGSAAGRFRRVTGAGSRRNGFPKAGCEGGADGALVLVRQMELLHGGRPVDVWRWMGVVGSGILVVTCWISVLASQSCFSRVATRSW